MKKCIDITDSHKEIIVKLVEKYLPNTTIWVYGSRVKNRSRPQSDLDMIAFAIPEQKNQVFNLKEAFDESDLPFRVDLFVWDEIPKQFKNNITKEHLILV